MPKRQPEARYLWRGNTRKQDAGLILDYLRGGINVALDRGWYSVTAEIQEVERNVELRLREMLGGKDPSPRPETLPGPVGNE